MRKLIVVLSALCVPACTYYLRDDLARAPREWHSAKRPYGLGMIGLSLARRRDGAMVVARVAAEGPADLADIRPGDRLVAIDDRPTHDLTIGEAARMIRGRVDTAVELRVHSPRGARLITLVRAPAASVWGNGGAPCERGCSMRYGGRCGAPCGSHRFHGRYDRSGESEAAETAPPMQAWPPTKPGHVMP